jgi:hypothetical protein
MADELSTVEKAVLLILMAEAREVANTVLTNTYRVELTVPSRDKLRRQRLIAVRTEKRRLYLELEEPGWKRCMQEFGSPVPAGAGSAGAALYAMLAAVKRFLDHSDTPYADFFAAQAPVLAALTGADVETRIREAYARAVRRPGDWAKLADLRRGIRGVAREDVDRALVLMNRRPDVTLVPESNQASLTADDRAAAIVIGNQDKHLISIEV